MKIKIVLVFVFAYLGLIIFYGLARDILGVEITYTKDIPFVRHIWSVTNAATYMGVVSALLWAITRWLRLSKTENKHIKKEVVE